MISLLFNPNKIETSVNLLFIVMHFKLTAIVILVDNLHTNVKIIQITRGMTLQNSQQ